MQGHHVVLLANNNISLLIGVMTLEALMYTALATNSY